MKTEPTFNFDGFGINGPDEYKSRVATFTPYGLGLNCGPLLAAAPDLLEALKNIVASTKNYRVPNPVYVEAAQAAIARAGGDL